MTLSVVEQTIVVEKENTGFVTTAEQVPVVVADSASIVVIAEQTGFLLLDTDTASVVTAGSLGPQGLPGVQGPAGPQGPQGPAGITEDELAYSKRIDFVSDNLIYRGEAAVGSTESAPVWRIRKIQLALDGDVTETWASGVADFNKSWTLRETYVYS